MTYMRQAIAFGLLILSAARVWRAQQQQKATPNIEDGQTIPLWSGAAPARSVRKTVIFQ
jgi:hypothetical protein